MLRLIVTCMDRPITNDDLVVITDTAQWTGFESTVNYSHLKLEVYFKPIARKNGFDELNRFMCHVKITTHTTLASYIPSSFQKGGGSSLLDYAVYQFSPILISVLRCWYAIIIHFCQL